MLKMMNGPPQAPGPAGPAGGRHDHAPAGPPH
jgi:hypothetical protein